MDDDVVAIHSDDVRRADDLASVEIVGLKGHHSGILCLFGVPHGDHVRTLAVLSIVGAPTTSASLDDTSIVLNRTPVKVS